MEPKAYSELRKEMDAMVGAEIPDVAWYRAVRNLSTSPEIEFSPISDSLRKHWLFRDPSHLTDEAAAYLLKCPFVFGMYM